MNKKDKFRVLFQYLPIKDQKIALLHLQNSNWDVLKEIVDSDFITMKKLFDEGQVSKDIMDGVEMLKISLDDFIDQYNIDIPYADYEEIPIDE